MIQLNKSKVIFDPIQHTYTLDDKPLKGITGLIRSKLFPDEYKNVPEHVLAKAAERGHRIHSALELYDNTGIFTEDCKELEHYIASRDKFTWLAHHLASEYIVSDEEQFASGIDKVYESPDGGVILADIKTTYKIPIDYVTWQLSIYRFFFNILNPDIKVDKAYVIWLREDKVEIIQVELLDTDLVIQLLYSDDIPVLQPSVSIDETELLRLKKKAEEATEAYENAKKVILERMVSNNASKFDGLFFSISCTTDGERTSFDSKAFKADHPDTYKQYTKTSKMKPYIKIFPKNG